MHVDRHMHTYSQMYTQGSLQYLGRMTDLLEDYMYGDPEESFNKKHLSF